MSPMKYIDKYIYFVTGQLVRSVVRLAARWLSVFVGGLPSPISVFVCNSASAASLQQAKLPTNVHLKCENISLLTNPFFFSFSIYIQNLEQSV